MDSTHGARQVILINYKKNELIRQLSKNKHRKHPAQEK